MTDHDCKQLRKNLSFQVGPYLGFGFAEVYDFTDELSMLDGRIVYVYNKHDKKVKENYKLSEIRKTGIALGPIRLYKFPNTRGLHSWKYLFRTDDFLITEIPETKELQAFHSKEDNWDNFKGKWHNSNYDIKQLPKYVDYDKVRYLETRIINGSTGIVKKFSMKVILDNNEKVSDYYDLSELGNKNMFVQMINTYYPLRLTIKYLRQIPNSKDKKGG